jgi:hypothetical protein
VLYRTRALIFSLGILQLELFSSPSLKLCLKETQMTVAGSDYGRFLGKFGRIRRKSTYFIKNWTRPITSAKLEHV